VAAVFVEVHLLHRDRFPMDALTVKGSGKSSTGSRFVGFWVGEVGGWGIVCLVCLKLWYRCGWLAVMTANPFACLARRRFLRYSLAGFALLVGGGTGGLLGLRGCAQDQLGLRALSAQDFRTLSALAEAILPAGNGFPKGARELLLPEAFDHFLADEPEFVASDLRMALTLVEFGPVWFSGRAATFSHLPVQKRLALFLAWSQSERLLLRQVTLAFRKFFCLVFYDHEEVWPHIGYDGPSAKRVLR